MGPPPPDNSMLSSAQAAALLGVKVESVYAYASRGLLQSHRVKGLRGSVFARAEVQALADRSGRGRSPAGSVERISTAVTVVDDDQLYYRGQDATELARTATVEQVADLLWGAPHQPERWAAAAEQAAGLRPHLTALRKALPTSARAMDRLRVAVLLAGAGDQLRHFVSDDNTTERTRQVVAISVAALGAVNRPAEDLSTGLWAALTNRPAPAAELAVLRAAVILLADHGLAASTVAARVAASARASIYSVLSAGLGVLDGPLHGGSGRQCLRFLNAAVADPAGTIGDYLAAGTALPGWGQLIYQHCDPRADLLLDMLSALPGADLRALEVIELCRPLQQRTEHSFPNIDLALAALTHVLGLPADTPETIFALARMVGWTAHALEEYAAAPLRFRPVGVYVGPRPTSADTP